MLVSWRSTVLCVFQNRISKKVSGPIQGLMRSSSSTNVSLSFISFSSSYREKCYTHFYRFENASGRKKVYMLQLFTFHLFVLHIRFFMDLLRDVLKSFRHRLFTIKYFWSFPVSDFGAKKFDSEFGVCPCVIKGAIIFPQGKNFSKDPKLIL
jgi:hypothetical protein